MANEYIAPITLGFTPADGDLIRGTVNGVEVRGEWTERLGGLLLYREGDTDTPICAVEFIDGRTVVSVLSDSAPTTDYELHLYRYVPADIVQIPQEYVEGLEATAADATEAKTTAETAQSTANAAKTTAESIDMLGKTWTQSNGPSLSIRTIVYANGLWMAEGGDNNNSFKNGLYYSTDGKTWTKSNVTSDRFSVIVYANDLWVAGSDSNKGLYYSTDGKTWTQSNVTSGYLRTVVYANDLWVAGRDSGLYYSTDGKTWTQSNVTSLSIHTVVYANGLWVAGYFDYSNVVHGSSPTLYYSTSKYALTDTVDAQLAEVKQSIDEIKSADVILPSSTAGSTKKFKITVDDAGMISAKEVTE